MIQPGTQLQGRFLIEELIGEGGMGAVYLAVDEKFGTRVAIKETFYGERELAEAFEREARLLNGLHHPILPHVSDFFSETGGHFLVMEYIDGEDFSAILKRGERFAVDEVTRWTLDLLDGLDYLHSQSPPIIHRDIKPNNLKLTSRGNIVLLDFGMAKETSGNTLGMRSVFGYSRRYSPLEQIEGTGTDERSDIFSLGATVFHLLTGKPPVDVLARASAIVTGRPDPLTSAFEVNPEVPRGLSAAIDVALSLNQDMRFESAAAMRDAVEKAIGMPREDHAAADEKDDRPARHAVSEFAALEAYEAEIAGKAARTEPPALTSEGKTVHLGTIDIEDDLPGMPIAAAEKKTIEADTAKVIAALQTATVPPRLRIRKPARRRALVWVPLLLLAAASVLGYAFYPGSSAAEIATRTVEQPVETANQEAAEPPVTETAYGGAAPDAASVAEDEDEEESSPLLDTTAEPEPPVVGRLKRSEPIARRKEPAETDVRKAAAVKRPEKEVPIRTPRQQRNGLAVRPRIVGLPTDTGRPAYKIGSVMNGGPRRPWWDERRRDRPRRVIIVGDRRPYPPRY